MPGGEVSPHEFCHWLWSKDGAQKRSDHRSTFALNKGLQAIKKRFRKAVSETAEAAGWEFIFNKYDEDGEGGLDRLEFLKVKIIVVLLRGKDNSSATPRLY